MVFLFVSFGAENWFLLVTVFALAAAGMVFLLYFSRKGNKELTRGQVRILSVLRFLSFFLIAFLLLSPLMKRKQNVVQQPVIILAWDNSGSLVSTGDSARVAGRLEQMKQQLSEELGNAYSLIQYTFGEQSKRGGEVRFSDKKSDYSELITTINNNHFNDPIGALLIAGDGIYNQGKNPVNMLDQVTYPVYTIGLGDTTEIADARIQNVLVNRTSFSGNRFPAVIEGRFSKLAGRPVRLLVRREDEIVGETVITPPNNDYFHSHEFILEAGESGLKHFSALIEPVENERNKKNNRAGFVLNVLENKQKILILSDGPHPDAGAVKNTLESQKSYEVSLFTEEPYPSNFSDFNLVILNQLPTSRTSLGDFTNEGEVRKTPLLFIVGSRTFLSQLNALDVGAGIEPLAGSPEEAQAAINASYATFTVSEEFREMVPRFPPLMAPYANYSTDAALTPLLFQKIKNVETAKPLLSTGIVGGRKTGFLFGEGIWRWRLYNYYFNQSHEQFNELVNQLVQYLALRENEDNFMIDFEPVVAEIEDVLMKAEVYNDAYERITTGEVNILIRNEQGDEFPFTFDVRGDAYFLNAGKLPLGNYHFNAEVTLGEKTFTESGDFTVTAIHLENVVTRANHRMLYQLASRTGGAFFLPGETGQLIHAISNTPKLQPLTSVQTSITDLLNLRGVFFVLLIMLGVEWFLRKYWGIY